jgi:hypothetical protein
VSVVWLLVGAFASAAPAEAAASQRACDASTAWNDGRTGRIARPGCGEDAYLEAHRLGEAVHALETERVAIIGELASLDETARAIRLRRQRQIDNDLEALRGIATIRGWAFDTIKEHPR